VPGREEVGAPVSLDGVAVHPDCWSVCLCYLHFAPENPEEGEMYLLVPAHPGCPGQSPKSCKMLVCVNGLFISLNRVFCEVCTEKELGLLGRNKQS